MPSTPEIGKPKEKQKKPKGLGRVELTTQEQQRIEHLRDVALDWLERWSLPTIAGLVAISEWVPVRNSGVTTSICIERTRSQLRLIYDVDFILNYVHQSIELVGIIIHEILHKVLKHLDIKLFRILDSKSVANVALDAVINSSILKMVRETTPRSAGFPCTKFFEDFYPYTVPDVLLKTPSVTRRGRKHEADRIRDNNPNEKGIEEWIRMREVLYNSESVSERDVYDFLERKLPKQDVKVFLIGSHGEGEGEEGDENEMPILGDEDLKDLCEELAKTLENAGHGAGFGSTLMEKVISVGRKHSDLFKRVMQEAIVSSTRAQIVSEFAEDRKQLDRTVVPPPILARKDLVALALGQKVFFYQQQNPEEDKHGAAFVYIDVSGSTCAYQEWMYSVVLALKRYLAPRVFLFSNKIAEITVDDLAAGKLQSTYGTDFDCVINHLVQEEEVTKAILFTDGMASLSGEGMRKLTASGKDLYGVLIKDGYYASSYYTAMDKFCRKVFEIEGRILREASDA